MGVGDYPWQLWMLTEVKAFVFAERMPFERVEILDRLTPPYKPRSLTDEDKDDELSSIESYGSPESRRLSGSEVESSFYD